MNRKPRQFHHSLKIKVQFFDVDPLGIVWHGNYLKYFEMTREDFGNKIGISYLDFKKNGFATPVVKTITDYKKPLHYGDTATVYLQFIDTAAAKLIFEYTIKNQNDELVCTGTTVQVFTALETGELSYVLPTFYEKWKASYKLDLEK